MTDLEFPRRIISILEGDGPIKDKLSAAANVFWSATFHADSWPAPLRAQMDELLLCLLSSGTLRQTLEKMDEGTAHETAGLLLRFAREFEQSSHGK